MYLLGDTHGLRPIFSIIDANKFEGQNLIHVGDFGLGFVSLLQDLKNLDLMDQMLMETNNHLYVIRGNHDNPIFWDRSKGLNLPRFHNLRLMDDFTTATIEDKNVLFVGGAVSIDRRPRMDDVPWPSWWKDEVFKYDEDKLDFAVRGVKSIDVVVTHSAPDFCPPIGSDNYLVNNYHEIEMAHGINLHEELAQERAEITRMYNDLTLHYKMIPKHWFYGHFHNSKSKKISGTQFKLLNINEVYELK